MLHLHRFHDEQLAPKVDGVSLADEHLDHRSLHGREDRSRLPRSRLPCSRRRAAGGGRRPPRLLRTARIVLLAVHENRERVRVVHPGPGEHRRRRCVAARRERSAGPGYGVRPAPGQQVGEVRLHEPGMETAGHDLRMGEKAPEERDVGRDPREPELPERPAELAGRRREGVRTRLRVTPHDHLGDQRVEARIRGISRVSARIDAHPGTARRLEGFDGAAGRAHRTVRLQGFEIHPRLRRVAAAREAVPPLGQRRAARELELEADEVDPESSSVTVCSTWIRGLASMK